MYGRRWGLVTQYGKRRRMVHMDWKKDSCFVWGGGHGGCASLLLGSMWPGGLLQCVGTKRDEGEVEIGPGAVAEPSFPLPPCWLQQQPHHQPCNRLPPALRSTSCLIPPSSQLLSGVRVALHSSCLFKDRNLHFSLHFWRTEIPESLNHLACP